MFSFNLKLKDMVDLISMLETTFIETLTNMPAIMSWHFITSVGKYTTKKLNFVKSLEILLFTVKVK